MDKRFKIVLNYQYNENWIGGTYYIQNLIHALNTLEDAKKPILLISSSNQNSVTELKQLTNYPYLEKFIPYLILCTPNRVINLLCRKTIGKNLFNFKTEFDVVFPASFFIKEDIEKQIFWIPDFQEKYLPQFFSQEEITDRDNCYQFIKENALNLVFSSEDAKNDFDKFYQNAKPKKYILNFATFHKDQNLPFKESIYHKFGISGDYFLCSNQFWIHKNQKIVLEAIALLKQEGINIKVIFTGKENDYRNPDYFTNLKKRVEELNVEENVKFLGFIDREDQIVLLKNCKAVIQSSLFEGWSTLNEDAKAENVFILASNLKVNIEQLKNYANHRLFDPYDEKSLAEQIKKDNFVISKINYQEKIINFGEKFLEIVENISKNNE